jgi:hypothetical protein
MLLRVAGAECRVVNTLWILCIHMSMCARAHTHTHTHKHTQKTCECNVCVACLYASLIDVHCKRYLVVDTSCKSDRRTLQKVFSCRHFSDEKTVRVFSL